MDFYVLPDLYRKRIRRTAKLSLVGGSVCLAFLPFGLWLRNGPMIFSGFWGAMLLLAGCRYFSDRKYYKRMIRLEDDISVRYCGKMLSRISYDEVNGIEVRRVYFCHSKRIQDKMIVVYTEDCTSFDQWELKKYWDNRGYYTWELFLHPECILFEYNENALALLRSKCAKTTAPSLPDE